MMDEGLLGQLSAQAAGILKELDPIIEDWSNGGNPTPQTINIVFRGLHTIKGGFGFFGLENIKHLAHALEDDLSEVREMVVNLTPEHAKRCGQAMSMLRELCADPGTSDDVDLTEIFTLLKFFKSDKSREEIEEFEHRWPLEPNERQCRQALSSSRIIFRITMKTKADIEDQGLTLLDMNDLLTALGNPLAVAVGMDDIMGLDNCLSMDLRYQVLFMSTVSLEDLALTLGIDESCVEELDIAAFLSATSDVDYPVTGLKYLLHSIAKVSGDLALRLHKQVSIEIDAEDMTLPTAYRLALQSCLIHLLRNALDHGIEMPDKRVAKGKEALGHIKITVRHDESGLSLRIIDDGAGIDQGRVLSKAIEKGLVATDATFADKNEIYVLLFAPGFSTCDSVNEVSGRGVGMDVVKSEITDLGGSLSVDSEFGAGSTFSVQLPAIAVK